MLPFFKQFGAAWAALSPPYGDTTIKTLASVGSESVSVAINGCIFAIPTLIPNPAEEGVAEYFKILADGVVSLWDKLKGELPEWAHQYRFPEEVGILATKQKLWEEISQIEVQVSRFERLKRVLVLQGEPLVEAVMEVFDVALPLKARREEAFREDFMLIDSSGDPAALAEVKGVSKGVAREHVNQADTHRERYEMSAEFPSLLIINTNMKHSTALADKDQPVAPEQIRYAALHNVLVLRTLDLLNLASLHLSKKLNSEAVVELLTKSRGWLRVVGDTPEVLSN